MRERGAPLSRYVTAQELHNLMLNLRLGVPRRVLAQEYP